MSVVCAVLAWCVLGQRPPETGIREVISLQFWSVCMG